MRFNGVDINTIHPAISRGAEIAPGTAGREINTLETAYGSMIASVDITPEEYTVRANIKAASIEEAMEARAALAKWACSSGKQTGELEPTHMPGRAYKAILKRMGRIEKRCQTVDIVFMLTDGLPYSTMKQKRTAVGNEVNVHVSCTAPVQPVISIQVSRDTNGLKMLMNEKPLLMIADTVYAGQTVEFVLETGLVTVDGAFAGNKIVYTDTDPDAEMLPGNNTVSANTEGRIAVRWYDKWL